VRGGGAALAAGMPGVGAALGVAEQAMRAALASSGTALQAVLDEPQLRPQATAILSGALTPRVGMISVSARRYSAG
jgi:hypothetical protein